MTDRATAAPNRRQMIAAAGAAAALAPAGGAAAGAPAALGPLLDTFMEENLTASPEQVTRLGLDRGAMAAAKSRLDDRSVASVASDRARTADQLRRLKALDRRRLSGMDAVNYDTVLFLLETRAEANRRYAFGGRGAGSPYVLGQGGGAFSGLSQFLDTQHAVASREDADAYMARLEAIPRALDGEVERSRRDAGDGVVPPIFLVQRGARQVDSHLATPTDRATLVTSIGRRAGERGLGPAYETQARKLYESTVRPALARQAAQYAALQARATDDAGVWKLKDGAGYYELSLKSSTTADGYDADAVHKLGLELTRDYTAQLDAFFKARGLTQGSVGERIRALSADSRFVLPNTPESKAKLLADCTAKMRAVEARLPKYFKTLPKTAVEVRAVPETAAATTGPGYYQPGTLDGTRPGAYYINLRDTRETPTWGIGTVSYHEATPGHHLQVTLMQEAGALPLLRRSQGFSGYAEGWALYAEKLADEMGMYDDDPWGRVGYFQSALFRAGRMVVDTGIHAKRWTREQAIKWMAETTGYPETMTTTEIERYCAGPGQACSYMLGRIVWDRLRDRSRAALGVRFDMGEFHDAGLLAGAMPLTVLERVIGDYIATKTGSPASRA